MMFSSIQAQSLMRWGYNWTESNYPSPLETSTNSGMFDPANVQILPREIRLTLDQTLDENGVYHSSGAEIVSSQLFWYGIFTFRVSIPEGISGTTSSGFLYVNGGETEIDVEQEGSKPGTIDLSTWYPGDSEHSYLSVQTTTKSENPRRIHGIEPEFHEYKIIWAATHVDWYIDNVLIISHTKVVPTRPAYFIFNIWGSNHEYWSGPATPNHPRTMIVTDFAYQISTGD